MSNSNDRLNQDTNNTNKQREESKTKTDSASQHLPHSQLDVSTTSRGSTSVNTRKRNHSKITSTKTKDVSLKQTKVQQSSVDDPAKLKPQIDSPMFQHQQQVTNLQLNQIKLPQQQTSEQATEQQRQQQVTPDVQQQPDFIDASSFIDVNNNIPESQSSSDNFHSCNFMTIKRILTTKDTALFTDPECFKAPDIIRTSDFSSLKESIRHFLFVSKLPTNYEGLWQSSQEADSKVNSMLIQAIALMLMLCEGNVQKQALTDANSAWSQFIINVGQFVGKCVEKTENEAQIMQAIRYTIGTVEARFGVQIASDNPAGALFDACELIVGKQSAQQQATTSGDFYQSSLTNTSQSTNKTTPFQQLSQSMLHQQQPQNLNISQSSIALSQSQSMQSMDNMTPYSNRFHQQPWEPSYNDVYCWYIKNGSFESDQHFLQVRQLFELAIVNFFKTCSRAMLSIFPYLDYVQEPKGKWGAFRILFVQNPISPRNVFAEYIKSKVLQPIGFFVANIPVYTAKGQIQKGDGPVSGYHTFVPQEGDRLNIVDLNWSGQTLNQSSLPSRVQQPNERYEEQRSYADIHQQQPFKFSKIPPQPQQQQLSFKVPNPVEQISLRHPPPSQGGRGGKSFYEHYQSNYMQPQQQLQQQQQQRQRFQSKNFGSHNTNTKYQDEDEFNISKTFKQHMEIEQPRQQHMLSHSSHQLHDPSSSQHLRGGKMYGGMNSGGTQASQRTYQPKRYNDDFMNK